MAVELPPLIMLHLFDKSAETNSISRVEATEEQVRLNIGSVSLSEIASFDNRVVPSGDELVAFAHVLRDARRARRKTHPISLVSISEPPDDGNISVPHLFAVSTEGPVRVAWERLSEVRAKDVYAAEISDILQWAARVPALVEVGRLLTRKPYDQRVTSHFSFLWVLGHQDEVAKAIDRLLFFRTPEDR